MTKIRLYSGIAAVVAAATLGMNTPNVQAQSSANSPPPVRPTPTAVPVRTAPPIAPVAAPRQQQTLGHLIVLSPKARIAKGPKSQRQADAQARQIGTQLLQSIKASPAMQQSMRVTTGVVDVVYVQGLNAAQIAQLKRDPRIAYIEAEQVMEQDGIDTNPANWGADRIDQIDLPLDNSHEYSLAQGVHIYILDDGIDASHPEFGGRVVEQQNFSAEPNQTCSNHGTYVASFAAGSTRGIARGAKIHDIKIGGCNILGTNFTFVSGVNHVVNTRSGPSVINYSASFYPPLTSVDNAARAALDAGVVFVTSSGNQSGLACIRSPNRVLEILTVAASDKTDKWAYYSNRGPCVDLIAPGTDVNGARLGGQYGLSSPGGTSMASPMVAGVAASIWAEQPSLSAPQVMQAVVNAATPNTLTNVPAGTANRLAHYKPGVIGANQPPLAIPGANFFYTFAGQTGIMLNGSQSNDPDGHVPLSYQWTQSTGMPVTLSNANSATPTFTAPPVTSTQTLNFNLKVTDNLGAVSVQQATVGIQVAPPVCSPYHDNPARILQDFPILTVNYNGKGTVRANLPKVQATLTQYLADGQAANPAISAATATVNILDFGTGPVPSVSGAPITEMVPHSATFGSNGFQVGTSNGPATGFWDNAPLSTNRWFRIRVNLSYVGANTSYLECSTGAFTFRLPSQPQTGTMFPRTRPLEIFDGKTGTITSIPIETNNLILRMDSGRLTGAGAAEARPQ